MDSDWISIKDQLPIQKWGVRVKNGKKVVDAFYYRKKWYWWDRKLHKVTHWEKCPVTYPKIPLKDMRDFLNRAKKYKHQIQKRKFTF